MRWGTATSRSGDGLGGVLKGHALDHGMSGLATEQTKVVMGVVHGDVASEGVAVFSSVTDFHAISTHDWSVPNTGCCCVSVTLTRLTVGWREGGTRPPHSCVEAYQVVWYQIHVDGIERGS